jgi:multiple sugar transport system substrate-binding protein
MAAPPGTIRRRTTALLSVLSALALLPVLAGCGGVRVGDAGAGTFTTMGYGMGDALATDRIATAAKALPGLHIQVDQGAFDEQQFLSAVAAGDPPDVVHMDRSLIGGYAARGALMPLTDCLAEKHVARTDFYRTAIDEGSLDGTVYALPDSYDSRMLFIDGPLLRKDGVDPASFGTSDWKDLKKLTTRLKRESGGKVTRIGFDPKIPEFFPLWVRANGGELISADGRTAHLDDPKVVQALTYAVGLVDAQGGWGKFKSLRDSFDMFGKDNEFTRNQLGVFPIEDWYLGVLAGVSPGLDLVTEPFESRDGTPLNYTSGYGWAIPKGSAHPAAACTFITTMTRASTWVHAARAKAAVMRRQGSPYTGDITGNVAADRTIEHDVWKPTGKPAYDKATRLLFSLAGKGFAVPSNAAGSEFTNAWQDAVNRVLSGQQSPRAALEQAQKEAQSALDLANQGRR